MATAKDRKQFVSLMSQEIPGTNTEYLASLLLRHAKTHGRLAEESCNGHPAQSSPHMPAEQLNKLQEKWDARIELREAQVERRIKEICEELGICVKFGGDPRGYTVTVFLPSGKSNTWGGKEEGYGIPQ